MAQSSQVHPAHAPRSAAVSEAALPLRELLAILRRRRGVIFWVATIVTTVALLIGFQVRKTYTATTQVMIEPNESRIVDVEKVAPGLPAEDSAIIETHIKLIQSRATLARAVDNLNLVSDARFARDQAAGDPSAGGPVAVLAGWLPDWMADQLPARWALAAGVTAGAQGLDPDPLRDQAIDVLQDGVKVAQAGRSYVVSISYTSERPHDAARIANGIAEAYVDVQLDEKLSATRRASAWLREQVEQLRWRVFGSEIAMEEFRAANGLVESERAPLDAQQLAVITNALIDARAERSAREARLQSLRAMRETGGLESAAEVLSSPLILSLREREMDLSREEAQLAREYGEHHPLILQLRAEQQKLTDRIEHEIDNVIANLENDVAVARSRERAHAEHLSEAKGQSAVTGQAEVQLRELEREVAASRSLYETLLVRLKETEQQQEIVQADARLISPAQTPDAPSSPSPKLFAMVGFTTSLVLGSILAVLLEQLDDTLRTDRQVEELLGVPSLGLVPRVPGVAPDLRLHHHMIDRPQSAYAEAVHALHTQLWLAGVDRPPPSAILVTSAVPGEGKTSLAASLAVFAVQLGHKTLLVDLDLRRPAVAREFDAAPPADLLGVLAGSGRIEDAIVRDPDSGVALLAAGHGHDNPITLLTSKRLKAVLRAARECYDCVIIDTPPVLGLPDVNALAALADAILLVVRWDRTRRDAVAAALRQLADASAKLSGVVLNQVDIKKHPPYSYGYAAPYYVDYGRS